jgi:nitrite reductase/ring-hydroxylating ferredoxin subunit/predicted secreted protein
MTDDGLVRVLPSDQCPRGTPQEPVLRLMQVGDRDVMLVRLEDETVVGVAAHCPHQGTELSDASFFDGLLRCPRHLYLYDPRTGENIVPARDARPENLWKLCPGYLPTYRVQERDGWIWVAAEPSPPPRVYDPEREKRPPETGWKRATDAAAAAAEPPPAAGGPVEHPTKTLRVRPGATFELRLPVSAKPGHVWRVEVTAPLKLLSEQYDPSPPRHRVRLAAKGAGVATVRCSYARPWDTEAAEVRAYVVRVEPVA